MSDQVVIPTIDISSFRQNSGTDEARSVVERVKHACTTYGFLQIVGHGVPRDLQADVLKGAAAFFALPLEEKIKLDRLHHNAHGKGYEILKTQEQTRGLGGDLKEGFYASAEAPLSHPLVKANAMGTGPNRWPPPEVLPYSLFKEPVERYLVEMHRVVRVMFSIVAAGMPYGPSIFDDFMEGVPMALLSPKHYPPSTQEGMGSNAHTDFGTITLLLQDQQSGLQVLHDDEWIDVKPNPDAYVVNIGDMLSGLTRGQYKSTTHRVLASRAQTHRYSLPFFFNGNIDYKLVPFDGLREGETAHTVKEHIMERLRRTVLKENQGNQNKDQYS